MPDTKKIELKKAVIIGAAAVIVVGAGAFYCGKAYGNDRSTRAGRGDARGEFRMMAGDGAGRPGAGGMRFTGQGGGFIGGEIIAKDDTSITVKMRDGSTKIVFYSASTEIGKTAVGTPTDLEVGKTVMATGKTNDDGSVTAQSIQLRPLPSAPAGTEVPKN